MSDVVNLGSFTLDPGEKEFQDLRSVCEPGNPWRCLIATKGSMELGKRMSVRLDHETGTGTIGITNGDWRFERPMTPAEVSFARRFDLGEALSKPLTVTVNLSDETWQATPKQTRGGRKTAANNQGRGPNNRAIKSIRARQLEAIRLAHLQASEDASGHGYTAYTNGCRCDICKRAKADYTANRRAEAIRTPDLVITDPAVTHGRRSTYDERGCRCDPCVTAYKESRGRSWANDGRAVAS